MFPKLIFSENFRVPLVVLVCIFVYLILSFLSFKMAANIIIILATALGSFELFKKTFLSIAKRQFALDYIAILAILVSLYTQEFLVAAILALMIVSGRTLEDYASAQAKKSLVSLADRIPDEITLWIKGHSGDKKKIGQVKVSEQILIRKGEVIPLDGILISEAGLIDESSITGEPNYIEKFESDKITSGTINVGEPMVVEVTRPLEQSTYSKILDLVKKAQSEKSPMVRLADRYSVIFTIVTFAIAGFAFFYSHFNLTSVLAVLAIATPCPLIIATPVALLGGVNSAAKRRIIVKKLASLEALSKVTTLIFDKTGTITIGKPKLTEIVLLDKHKGVNVLSVAAALERNSLHPLAKAVVEYASLKKAPLLHATNIKEQIGTGISGEINHQIYTLSGLKQDSGMAIQLTQGQKKLAIFRLEDQLKGDTKQVIDKLRSLGLKLYIFTGDKKETAEKIADQLGADVTVQSQLKPQDKQAGIAKLQKEGKVVAMIGDGINDAPALALSDVGLVFSNEEQTAASEAADIVFLGGDFASVLESLQISKRTVNIALQSIFVGIGLSIGGMIFASVGLIPPLLGAGLQEAIDVAVILNAIRAST